MTMIDWTKYEAVLFDLDGVLTPTASIHERAWTEMFNEFLAATHPTDRPFASDDYLAYVDGKQRFEGVRSFLASRGITLPAGDLTDPPGWSTVAALGNRKNDLFAAVLLRDGIAPYPTSVTLLDRLEQMKMPTAVVSSSRNAPRVLVAAQLADRFEVVIDGNVAAELGLRSKPAPDMFLEGARRLRAEPARSVVFEDAVSGVAAGRAGDFGLVIGVDRGAGEEALLANGADLVVGDLGDLELPSTENAER